MAVLLACGIELAKSFYTTMLARWTCGSDGLIKHIGNRNVFSIVRLVGPSPLRPVRELNTADPLRPEHFHGRAGLFVTCMLTANFPGPI